MKHFRALAVLAFLLSTPVQAELTGSLGGTYLDTRFQLVALEATLGWRLPLNESVSIQPELRGGIGINEDTVRGIDAEINNTFGANLRLQVDFDSGFYLFAQPTYVRPEFETDLGNTKDWEFGGGGGFGFMVNPNIGFEAGYERIDEADVFRGAVRVYF